MLSMKMKVDKKLLPIKGHFFFFNAGTAPLVPYLSTYARQLGFSSGTVGLIYTILPIFGLVAKPLLGVIADKFLIQKTIFIIFQIITIVSFFAIYFVPESKANVSVQLDCGNGATMLRSRFLSPDLVDQCKITALGKLNTTSQCNMNCEMHSPKMWETVCEHWHIPQYCYSRTNQIKYDAVVNNVTLKDGCAYIASSNVTLDGYMYTPHCRIGNGFVVINEPCQLNCSDSKLASALGSNKGNMTCLDNMLNFKICSNVEAFPSQAKDVCKASCNLGKSTPYRLMEICEGWGADVANTCYPKPHIGQQFPKNLSFIGTIILSTAISEHEYVFVQLKHIELPDGTVHYPYCISKAQYQMTSELFNTKCEISCDNILINEIFSEASESHSSQESEFTSQFWLFFLLMIISWIGQAVVVTFADAICFNLLGEKMANYGKQRLWGSVGFGVFSLLTGTLIDLFSDGAHKNYTVAFVLMFIFMSGDVAVSCLIKTESTRMSVNILSDIGKLLSSLPVLVFMLWTIAVGLCTGLLWNFLFWHLEDIAKLNCDGFDYIKTLQGLVSAIQTFGGEIPFMFVSGYVLRKLGHINVMSLVLFAFGVRFILYSRLTNAWWVLPIEMLQGITFGMFYPTMTSYASVVSPHGTETTVQGLVGAIFEGIGTSLGSFIGGRLFDTIGSWNTFLWFGCGSLLFCFLHMLVQCVLKEKYPSTELAQGYASVVKYEQPNDMVFMLEEDVADNE